jgi:hypothetical protein
MKEAHFTLARWDGRENLPESGGDVYVRLSDNDRVIISALKNSRDMTRITVVFHGIDHRETHSVLHPTWEVAEKLGLCRKDEA